MNKILLVLIFLVTGAFAQESTHVYTKTYKFIFSKKEFFRVSYADYPQGDEVFYELGYDRAAPLPAEISSPLTALKITGNNHSDDLFMYAYKKISGLKPDTRYHVSFSLEFASNAPTGSAGSGGSPGDSVYVKIGAVCKKPERYVDDQGYFRMVLDKGNQAEDGKDMILIGDVGVETANHVYRLKTLPYLPNEQIREKLADYSVVSNKRGEVWVVLGTDSGFESTSTIFYTNLVIGFSRQLSENL